MSEAEDAARAAAAPDLGLAQARAARRRRQASNPSEKRNQPRTVSARLTDDAYAQLVARAEAVGLGPSTYTALLIDADLGNRGKAVRWAPRQAPSETRDRAAALVRALGHLTGELKMWMKEAREIGVGDDAIDQIGRLTPLAREALAAAKATADDLRGD